MTRRWIAAAACAVVGGVLAVPMILKGGDEHLQGPAPMASHERGAAGCESEKKADYNHTLRDMNGADVRLADYKGKVVLLNFWGTWCGPCRDEIPALVALVEANRSRGFEVLGLAQQDTPEELRAFATQFKMNYPSLLSTEEVEDAFSPLWAVPTSILIDRQGSICLKHTGAVTKEQIEKAIKPLL